MRYRYWLVCGASILLALIFLISGVGKLLEQNAFLLDVSAVIIDPGVIIIVTQWLPWVELVLGVCLLIGIVPQLAAGISTLLIASFIFHNSWLIGQGLGNEPCGCLGILDRVLGGDLSTTGSLYIDIGLVILALAIYFAYPGRFLDVRPWFLKRRRVENGSLAESSENDSTEDSDLPGSQG